MGWPNRRLPTHADEQYLGENPSDGRDIHGIRRDTLHMRSAERGEVPRAQHVHRESRIYIHTHPLFFYSVYYYYKKKKKNPGFADDGSVARHVSLLLLHPVILSISSDVLRRRGRGHTRGCGDAHNRALLPLLLQRLQDSRSLRRHDLQDDNGWPSEIRLDLSGLRHGLLSRYIYCVTVCVTTDTVSLAEDCLIGAAWRKRVECTFLMEYDEFKNKRLLLIYNSIYAKNTPTHTYIYI